MNRWAAGGCLWSLIKRYSIVFVFVKLSPLLFPKGSENCSIYWVMFVSFCPKTFLFYFLPCRVSSPLSNFTGERI